MAQFLDSLQAQQVGETLPPFGPGEPRIFQEPYAPRPAAGMPDKPVIGSLRQLENIREFEETFPLSRKKFAPMALPDPFQSLFAQDLRERLSVQPTALLQSLARSAGLDPAPPVEQGELKSELIDSLVGVLRLIAPSQGI